MSSVLEQEIERLYRLFHIKPVERERLISEYVAGSEPLGKILSNYQKRTDRSLTSENFFEILDVFAHGFRRRKGGTKNSESKSLDSSKKPTVSRRYVRDRYWGWLYKIDQEKLQERIMDIKESSEEDFSVEDMLRDPKQYRREIRHLKKGGEY